MIAADVVGNNALLGPLAALALTLLFLSLFYTGKILPRNAVPREDYEKLMGVNASYAEALKTLTRSTDELVTAVRFGQKNGGA